MATAIIDIEFDNIPGVISGLQKYSHALFLVRFHQQPVGRVMLPVSEGCISRHELREKILSDSGWDLCERLVLNYIDCEPFDSQNVEPSTISVCTRDRPQDLQRCIEGLMRLPDLGQEIQVIDNCPSSDATEQIVKNYSRVRYFREEIPGLDAARNRALCEARNEIVVFIDDDAFADRNWLKALIRNFTDPMVMCVTGLTMPAELETRAQEWFERYSSFQRGFRRVRFSRENLHPLTAGRVGAGANMALRKRVIELVGFFDEALDAGTLTHSGGDTEMFSRILSRGYHIVYEPSALNWHRHRDTWRQLRKTMYGYGVGTYAFWARSFLMEGHVGVFKRSLNWFLKYQLKNLLRSLLKKRNSTPIDLLFAELFGCVVGPWAYLFSKIKQKRLQPNT